MQGHSPTYFAPAPNGRLPAAVVAAKTEVLGARIRRMRPAFAHVLLLALLLSAPASMADDATLLARALGAPGDFRVRVTAALALGKTHSPGALGPLVSALDDQHPAVRAAAAAAIGSLGQRDGVGALRGRLARERVASVRSQMATAIEILGAGHLGRVKGVKYLVQLGMMRNNSGVRGTEL
jgi:HEAT repeat protein